MAPTYGYPGQPPPPQAYAPGPAAFVATRTNGMATASLVMGLLGICVFPVFSVLAIIFGFSAKSQIKQRNEGGDGMATAGIVLGFVALAITAIFLIFFFSVVRNF